MLGVEKKQKILDDLSMQETINLENVELCPSFEKLLWKQKYCIYHAQKPSYTRYACAQNNAYRSKRLLNSNTVKQMTDSTAENEFTLRKNLRNFAMVTL